MDAHPTSSSAIMLEHATHLRREGVPVPTAGLSLRHYMMWPASGTMSLVTITKTRRCSGFGETIAYVLAKGSISSLDNLGIPQPNWLRPSRVLMNWISKPVVTPSLGHDLLLEMSQYMNVVIPTFCTATFKTNSKFQN